MFHYPVTEPKIIEMCIAKVNNHCFWQNHIQNPLQLLDPYSLTHCSNLGAPTSLASSSPFFIMLTEDEGFQDWEVYIFFWTSLKIFQWIAFPHFFQPSFQLLKTIACSKFSLLRRHFNTEIFCLCFQELYWQLSFDNQHKTTSSVLWN